MKTNIRIPKGFTLIEVVMALGICSFSLVAILGMFAIGFNSERESSGEFQAANLASLIVSQRRADPVNASVSLALPPLDQALSGWQETLVGWDGLPTTDPNAPFRMRYRAGLTNLPTPGSTDANDTTAFVCVSLTWPSAAPYDSPTVSRYELATEIQIP